MVEYEPPVYRPPGEWRSFLVQATIGCSHNGCTFCGMYKGKKFRVRPLDDILWDISKRALVSAWKAGCILWVMNEQTWTKAMGDLVEWLVYHDLWSKMQLFADMLCLDGNTLGEARRHGPKNMLDTLPDTFSEAQLAALRTSSGKSAEGTKNQLYQWVFRQFITYDEQTGMYTKTEKYQKGVENGKI